MVATTLRATRRTAKIHATTPATSAWDPFSEVDEALDDTSATSNEIRYLLRDGTLHTVTPPPRRGDSPDETPIEGKGAVARWLALHDRARMLRATLLPGDGVDERQALRAIRSLFLYEHQLAAKTRRQARTALWRRERAEPLPAFAERARWSRCRCPQCQPAVRPVGIAELLLRSA